MQDGYRSPDTEEVTVARLGVGPPKVSREELLAFVNDELFPA